MTATAPNSPQSSPNRDRSKQTIGRLKPPPLRKVIAIAIANARRRAVRSLLTIGSVTCSVAFITYIATATVLDGARAEPVGLTEDTAGAAAAASKEAEETIWIVTVSLLVCTVGIANAMLMSVTERYQEIGTIKCLGGMDSFVLNLFLFEAAGQGVIGGVVGLLVGLLLGLAGSLGGALPVIWTDVAFGTWMIYLLLCLIAGMILSMLAAVYPAWVAMRMAPIEALRARF